MSTFKRNGNKWSVNEILRLQREFELLELSIDDIATRHQRSPDAIMYKLDNEGFANFNVLYSNYYNLNDAMPILDDNNHEEVSHVYEDNDVITNNNITTLTEKVWNLETSVNEIKGLVKQMFNLMPNNPNLAIY
jgi:hypothetical protein